MLEYWGQILTRPQLSLSLLLILTREARWREVRGMMGRRKETSFPLSPSHRPLRTSAVIVSRDSSLTAYKIVRGDWGRVSGQIKLEAHIVERLNSNFATYGHGFLIRQFPPRKSIFLDRQRYSALLFKLNETAFFFGDKYCCYVKLALNITVSSLISRIKTIGTVFSRVFIRYKDTH